MSEAPGIESPEVSLRFDAQVAIVTGAGSGIGAAHARMLASRGASVVVNELPENLARAEAVCAEIEADGGSAIAVPGRVGVDADMRGLVDAAISTFGAVHMVVNNAGLPASGEVSVEMAPTETLERHLDVNLRGPLQLCRAAWPHLAEHGQGSIIVTGSANGTGWRRSATGYDVDYAASKAAAFVATRQLAAVGRGGGIRANTVLPWAYTTMVDDVIGGTDLGEWMQQNVRAEQVAAGAAWLLHPSCSVTGEAFSLAGGRMARIFFAATKGFFDVDLSPEKVRDHWSAIEGTVTADGLLGDVFEMSQPREQEVVARMLGDGLLPDIGWIAEQTISGVDMGVTLTA